MTNETQPQPSRTKIPQSILTWIRPFRLESHHFVGSALGVLRWRTFVNVCGAVVFIITPIVGVVLSNLDLAPELHVRDWYLFVGSLLFAVFGLLLIVNSGVDFVRSRDLAVATPEDLS
ncbi:hypothetical protein [Agreia bicolorata]|uniref:hypothetical protein n=1 Tax=Agreia bicolorata TaxID=110935 RepID=UPI000A4FDE46|nr:hypothetical protein [Agreia bicolorata]